MGDKLGGGDYIASNISRIRRGCPSSVHTVLPKSARSSIRERLTALCEAQQENHQGYQCITGPTLQEPSHATAKARKAPFLSTARRVISTLQVYLSLMLPENYIMTPVLVLTKLPWPSRNITSPHKPPPSLKITAFYPPGLTS